MFLGAIGKVVDIEENNSVKIKWINRNYHWLPAKACWIRWRECAQSRLIRDWVVMIECVFLFW